MEKARVSKRTGHALCVLNAVLIYTRTHTHIFHPRNKQVVIYKQPLWLSHAIIHVCCFFLLIFFFFYPLILPLFHFANTTTPTTRTSKTSVMGLFLSRNLACKFIYPFLFSKRVSKDLFPKQLENMMSLVSPRTGRHLQRYDQGCRQVVGCIPYRYKNNGTKDKELEVLVISAQKGHGMQFPKGGWEIDESMEQAALRETVEEAGVIGSVESNLGKWYYKSKRQPIMHEGYMFPLLVKKELDNWPEMNTRKRRWMTVTEAKEICPYTWMKEALDVLVMRQNQLHSKKDVDMCRL